MEKQHHKSVAKKLQNALWQPKPSQVCCADAVAWVATGESVSLVE
jgi:hypothetical protein